MWMATIALSSAFYASLPFSFSLFLFLSLSLSLSHTHTLTRSSLSLRIDKGDPDEIAAQEAAVITHDWMPVTAAPARPTTEPTASPTDGSDDGRGRNCGAAAPDGGAMATAIELTRV